MQNVLPLRWRRAPGALPLVAPMPRPADPPDAAEPTLIPSNVSADRVERLTMPPFTDEHRTTAHPMAVGAVDIPSLASIALRCAVVVAAAVGTGVLALWLLAVATGVVDRSESFMQSIGFRDFHISGAAVILGTVCIAAGLAGLAAVVVVVAGAAYNLLARHGGGLRIRLDEVAERPVAERPVAERTSAHVSATPVEEHAALSPTSAA